MGSSDDDFAEVELRRIKKAPSVGILKLDLDMFVKTWGWEMLLPYKTEPDWSDYCEYLQQYYDHNHTDVTGNSFVDAAKNCLEKEGELVSLWDSAMKKCTVDILPINTFILSSLVQEFADKVKRTGKKPSVVSTAALLCITKEADLICKMLAGDADPSDYTIIQSTKIRMCALSLTSHRFQLHYSVPATAAMLGIMKETNKICDWMRHNKKAFNVNDKNLDNDFRLGRQIRQGTLLFMTSLLEKSPFPVSVAAAEQKPVEEKYFSGNIPRNDENDVAPAEAANCPGTRGTTQDQEKIGSTNSSKKRKMKDADEEESDQELGSYPSLSMSSARESRYLQGDDNPSCHRLNFLQDDNSARHRLNFLQEVESPDDVGKKQMEICPNEDGMALDSLCGELEKVNDAKNVPPVGTFKFEDVFEAWDRLLQLMSPTEWSGYCKYLQQYYKCNTIVAAEDTGSLVEACLKKEKELVSLWKKKASGSLTVNLPVNTIVESNLIQEHLHSVKIAEEGALPVVSTVAFVCISKEADLICELLKHGAKLTDDFIQQSSMIRMCALSLMHLQGPRAIDAAAAMVGITKECKLMCDRIKKEAKLITVSVFTRHEPLGCCWIRAKTFDVMLSLLKESSFPTSQKWLDLVANI